MSKKRARLRFVWLAIVVAIGLFLTVAVFNVPFTNRIYNGFAGGIDKGLDITGGQGIVYKCSIDNPQLDLSKSIDDTANRIHDTLSRFVSGQLVVARQGNDELKIEAENVEDSIFDWFASPKKVFITKTQKTDDNWIDDTILTSKNIINVTPTYQLKDGSTSEVEYGVILEFGPEAKDIISKVNKDEIYVYLDEISTSSFATIKIDDMTSKTSAFITDTAISSDSSATVEYAYEILSGTYKVSLEKDRTYTFSGFLGDNTMLYIAIAGIVALVLIMAVLWIRYGDFGLLADFALLVYTILIFFFMMTIPLIRLSLPTVLGIAASYALVVDAMMIILNKIKEEYARGNKIHLAVKGGFKRSLFPLLDTHAVIAAISLIVYFIGNNAIKGFTFPLFVGTLLSFFLTQVVLRFFLKSYLPLNSTNPKKLRLYREKSVKEIQEVKEEKEPEGVNILAPNADKLAGGQDK